MQCFRKISQASHTDFIAASHLASSSASQSLSVLKVLDFDHVRVFVMPVRHLRKTYIQALELQNRLQGNLFIYLKLTLFNKFLMHGMQKVQHQTINCSYQQLSPALLYGKRNLKIRFTSIVPPCEIYKPWIVALLHKRIIHFNFEIHSTPDFFFFFLRIV